MYWLNIRLDYNRGRPLKRPATAYRLTAAGRSHPWATAAGARPAARGRWAAGGGGGAGGGGRAAAGRTFSASPCGDFPRHGCDWPRGFAPFSRAVATALSASPVGDSSRKFTTMTRWALCRSRVPRRGEPPLGTATGYRLAATGRRRLWATGRPLPAAGYRLAAAGYREEPLRGGGLSGRSSFRLCEHCVHCG